MNTAFLFPGQGSQFAGMGKSLAQAFPSARAVFEEADQALGFELSRLCFEGPEETLRLTENTQPAEPQPRASCIAARENALRSSGVWCQATSWRSTASRGWSRRRSALRA